MGKNRDRNRPQFNQEKSVQQDSQENLNQEANDEQLSSSDSSTGGDAPAVINNGASDESAASADAAAQASAPVAEQSAPAPSPAPAAQIAPAQTVKTAPVVEQKQAAAASTGITRYEDVNRYLADVPKGKHMVVQFMIEYADKMRPKRSISESEGASYQALLAQQLLNLINNEDEYFKPLFSACLRVMEHEAEGAFAATHVFRFLENVRLTKDERTAFTNTVDMMRLLGPVQGRKVAARQINLERAMAKGFKDSGRQRILSYFGDTIEK